jgi:hypothetical protein
MCVKFPTHFANVLQNQFRGQKHDAYQEARQEFDVAAAGGRPEPYWAPVWNHLRRGCHAARASGGSDHLTRILVGVLMFVTGRDLN